MSVETFFIRGLGEIFLIIFRKTFFVYLRRNHIEN